MKYLWALCYTYQWLYVCGMCKSQTWGGLNTTQSSRVSLFAKERNHRNTGNLSAITELLSGSGQTQATQSHRAVSTLSVMLTFSADQLGLSEDWAFIVLTQRGKMHMTAFVICIMLNGS